MRVAGNKNVFILFVVKLMASLCQLPLGAAMNHEKSQLVNWASDVVDQYTFSPESMDLRWKENLVAWSGCNSTIHINYTDPLTQAAYIRPTLAICANIVDQIIEEDPHLTALFENRALVNIVVIGCGPAPEMSGVLNYLLRHHHEHRHPAAHPPPPPMVRFLLADEAASWSLAVDRLENAIRADEPGDINVAVRPRFEKTFYQWDVAGEHQVALHLLPSLITGDLFIFQYIFWVILCQEHSRSSGISTATRNLRQVFASAPDGALFLIVDRPENREDLKMFLEENVLSSKHFTRLADSIRRTSQISGDDQSKDYVQNNITGQYEPATSDTQGSHVVLLYRKTARSSQNLET